jgi:hypothetical protein
MQRHRFAARAVHMQRAVLKQSRRSLVLPVSGTGFVVLLGARSEIGFANLNLTEDQRTKIRSIVQSAKSQGTSQTDVQSQINGLTQTDIQNAVLAARSLLNQQNPAQSLS